ncbi:hypothetical protein Dimus_009361 [Dionaea muscipula]
MGKKVKWSWTSALIGAASAAAAAAVIVGRPRDPSFQVTSINLTNFKLNFPVLDAELILAVHVTNPNIVPVEYSSTTMSIIYDGAILGSAYFDAGSQSARSCQLLRLPARMSGLQLAHHGNKFLADVARREMVLHGAVDFHGSARWAWWVHKFKVHVDSRLVVDPVLLDVIDQNNRSQIQHFC